MSGHVVWDWNGTLFDDLPIVIEAVNRSIAQFDLLPIGAGDYRDHYTRPVRNFYASLMRREISDLDWLRLDTAFHEHYFRLARQAKLTHDAIEAMDLLHAAGWTQSLLSMAPHEWLAQTVARIGITDRLLLVDGRSGQSGGLKAVHLDAHLGALDIDGEDAVAIGDTPDDVVAAKHVGAAAVLYNGGSHHRSLLEAEGVPVVDTLVAAAETILSRP